MSPSSNTCKQRIGKVHLNEKKRRKLNNFDRDLREEKVIVLENDNGLPSTSSKGDEYMTDAAGGDGGGEVKPQKNKLSGAHCIFESQSPIGRDNFKKVKVSLVDVVDCFI